MKIEIQITRTYDEIIMLTDDNLLEINDEYKGDVKRWVEDNYADLICLNNPDDEEIESIYYDRQEMNNKLEDIALKRNELLSNKIKNRLSYELQKHKADRPFNFEEWAEVGNLFDIETLKRVASFVAFNHPKFELEYIHINGNIIEATDSKKAIKIVQEKDIKTEILFPVSFIRLLEDFTAIYIGPDIGKGRRKLCLKLEDNFYISKSDFAYPDLSRIMDIKLNEEYKSHKYSVELFSKVMIDKAYEAIKISINEKQYYIARDANLFENFEINEIFIHEKQSYPLFFYNDNLKIAVMPIVLDENSIVDELR
jgi:hypothetical protein